MLPRLVIWNEGNQVCTGSAYTEAQQKVLTIGCAYSTTNDGRPVHLSCPVQTSLSTVTDHVTSEPIKLMKMHIVMTAPR